MTTMNSLLPEETVFEILTRLPVKSLCRFKCVCKCWLSTISSPKFAHSHFSRSKSRPKILIAITCESFPQSDDQGPHSTKEESRHLFIADPAEQLTHQLQIPVKKRSLKSLLGDSNSVAGQSQSVAGLMFGLDTREAIRIGNPSTKSQVLIPRSLMKRSFPREGIFHKRSRSVSIGFDPIESKYKILEFMSIVDEWNGRVMKMEYRVATVGDHGNWRSVEDGPLVHHKGRAKQEICINGVIYYVAEVVTISEELGWRSSECMVAFDVRSEKFQVAKLKIEGRINKFGRPCRLMEFEGEVAIVDFPFKEHALDIWVLEDFENQIWNLKYSGLPSPMKIDEYKLVGTTFSGELVFGRESSRKDEAEEKDPTFSLFFFDPKTEDFWSREFRLPSGFDMIGEVKISVMNHVETLMSLT